MAVKPYGSGVRGPRSPTGGADADAPLHQSSATRLGRRNGSPVGVSTRAPMIHTAGLPASGSRRRTHWLSTVHDRSTYQLRLVVAEESDARRTLLVRSKINRPHNTAVRLPCTTTDHPTRRCRVGPSPTRNRGGRTLDWFVTDQPAGVCEAGANVVTFEPGVVLQQGLARVARRQHAEDMLYRQPSIPDDGFATENVRVRGDSSKQSRFVDAGGHHRAPGTLHASPSPRLETLTTPMSRFRPRPRISNQEGGNRDHEECPHFATRDHPAHTDDDADGLRDAHGVAAATTSRQRSRPARWERVLVLTPGSRVRLHLKTGA